MADSTRTLGRRLIAGGLTLTSALLFGCGGGASDSTAPIVEQPPASPAAAIVTGAQLARSLGNTALVGQPYRSNVVVVPNDARNSVVALTIANPTVGGANPTIDVSGVVAWTPNEADFASTLELIITATLREGAAVTLVSPVSVRKERLVHQELLPAAAGTIADPNGRYLIQVEPETAGGSMNGTLSISEVYSANGSFVYVVRVPATSGARVTVLDAPETLVAAARSSAAGARSGATGAAGRARPLEAKEAATGWEADVGGQIGPISLSGNYGHVANAGDVNVYTTRAKGFSYLQRIQYRGEIYYETWSAEQATTFQIDANCTSVATCASIESSDPNDPAHVKRGPVILIHGFNLLQSVGGGDGTWGSLASVLSARGHPVFELRWNTYMRFEEAAGVLSTLSKRVAAITGHKVTVVAHSFGGIVAHLSMMGKGIRYQGDAWNSVPVDGVFQRLVTLGSPLSGIRKVVAEPYGLTTGRDDDDTSITACEAITCFQAGSSDQWDAAEIGELRDKVIAIDPLRIGLKDSREGESIRTLHKAWESGPGHRVPFSTVVSLQRRPRDYSPAALTNVDAFKLGDGLISIMGQAVLPSDFSARPFEPSKQYDIVGTLGAEFLSQLNDRFASPMETRTRNGREYFFALRAAHSCAQRSGLECAGGPVKTDYNYLIANYSDNGATTAGRVAVPGFPEADHPLRHFIESPAHLAEPRVAYVAPVEPPVAVVSGSLVRDGLRFIGMKVSFEIEDAASRTIVSDTHVEISSAGGEFAFNAGPTLAARFPGRVLNLADFNILVRAGDGLTTARVFLRAGLASTVPLGVIDLTPVRADSLVGVAGRVIDGQTESSPIAGADIYLMKGRGQSDDSLRRVRDTTTTRHLTADAGGRFSAAGLEPGYYSALVTKAGYLDQTQGSLFIAPDGSSSLTFSLLQALAADHAAVTLRWGAKTDGAFVSSDLDSHLKKFNSVGIQQYEIYFNQPNGSGTDTLDRDDIDYQGPETITLLLDSAARYVYFVHNYDAPNGSLLGPSRPSVSIRIGPTLREFSLPPGEIGTQRYWKVFEIVSGAVVPCESGCLMEAAP